ncbi:MAG: hypothetical protein P4M11_04480 [Candidatus Pacebacteria bacterium]|nr:hypothetical protein [Candidatus Paceibacterota bacterium]
MYPDADSASTLLSNTATKFVYSLDGLNQVSITTERSQYQQLTNALMSLRMNLSMVENGTVFTNYPYEIAIQEVKISFAKRIIVYQRDE